MADEGEHIQVESESNAGKWILLVLALLVVAGFGYSTYMTHSAVKQLKADLGTSQSEVKELQNRMQAAEAGEETLADHLVDLFQVPLADLGLERIYVVCPGGDRRYKVHDKIEVVPIALLDEVLAPLRG